MESKSFAVPAERAGERADVFLAECAGISRSHAKKLIEEGKVTLGGAEVRGSRLLKAGEILCMAEEKKENLDLEPQNIPLDIVYQDKDIAVINKPQGLTVHAGGGTHGSTLVNALLYHLDSLSGINGVIRPGIVHRIDKNTSGLLVVAKNDAAHLSLSEQIEKKTCKRIYIALLEGNLKEESGTIETHIARSEKDRKKMAVFTPAGGSPLPITGCSNATRVTPLRNFPSARGGRIRSACMQNISGIPWSGIRNTDSKKKSSP